MTADTDPPEGGGTPGHDAILLAGGRASRLGGIDKTALVSRGTALLDRAVAAAAGADRVAIVGLRDGREAPAGAVLTREDPPLSGPVAALGAGLAALDAAAGASTNHGKRRGGGTGEIASRRAAESPEGTSAEFTLVLACDLVRPEEAVAQLLASIAAPATADAAHAGAPRDGLIAVDEDGRRQPLLALYRASSLRAALDATRPLDDLPMRRLLGHLDLVEVPLTDELCADVDSPNDAARLT
jgi:molybdopterin-guanine dinucleotide biosynthesis protein A